MNLLSEIKVTHIIITRVDNIGDVVLSFPIAGLIKQHYPHCKITLMARGYTQALIATCRNIDNFVDWGQLQNLPEVQIIEAFKKLQASTIIHFSSNRKSDNKQIVRMAKKAGIRQRIARINYLYNWFYCNKLVYQRRRHSPLHETQLNIKLLKPLGIVYKQTAQQLTPYFNIKISGNLAEDIATQLENQRFNLIIHPGSNGHGREWPMEYYLQLVQSLPSDRFKIFLTGSAKEQERFQILIDQCPGNINLMGKLSLEQLIRFINLADGLIASGTGPLHLAAALGIHVLGLFPPIHIKRWAPIGIRAQYLVKDNNPCFTCNNSQVCQCMLDISVNKVVDVVMKWQKRVK